MLLLVSRPDKRFLLCYAVVVGCHMNNAECVSNEVAFIQIFASTCNFEDEAIISDDSRCESS